MELGELHRIYGQLTFDSQYISEQLNSIELELAKRLKEKVNGSKPAQV